MILVPNHGISIDSPNTEKFLNLVQTKSSENQILGRGSYGVVYKASYKNQPVAVKFIENKDNTRNNSIMSESNIIGWNHKNIIQILKIVMLDECSIIIMDRCLGLCIQHLIDTISVPMFHRLCILLDVACGLCYCHQNNVLHLDIKPPNILIAFNESLTKSNNFNRMYICKICDFGCSLKSPQPARLVGNSNTFVRVCYPFYGILQGTIRYMSPDALQALELTGNDDIYSLGITMWQLKMNRQPYSFISSNETVAYKVVKHDLRPDTEEEQQVHDEFVQRKLSIIENDTQLSSVCRSCTQCHIGEPRNFKTSKELSDLSPRTNIRSPIFLSADRFRRNKEVRKPGKSNVAKKLDFGVENVHKSTSTSRFLNIPIIHEPNKEHNFQSYDNFSSNNHLKKIFSEPLQIWYNQNSEKEYEAIYKRCWIRDSVKRPPATELVQIFNMFLERNTERRMA